MTSEQALPINEVLEECLQALRVTGQFVLAAPPGAGKTTGVPLALRRAFPTQGRILLLQPRRMAARAVAARLSRLLGSSVGNRVGYQVRLDRNWGDQSEIVVMTYGVVLRRMQSDPFLEPFGTVLLDEFHERSLEADLTLGMLHRVRTQLRPDLRIGVMSATLDAGPVSQFLGNAPVVESLGRMHPVKIQYAERMIKERLEEQVTSILPRVLAATEGHILVFLPGVGEIHRVAKQLSSVPGLDRLDVMALYGDLAPEKQDQVLAESARRKVILATNVAETSITIPGVTGVIDSGQARVMRMHPMIGLPRLDLEPISQASADQRAGRAGRTSPGICYRLWLQASHRARAEFDTPEIIRGDLSSAVLQLAGWGENRPLEFPWLTPPTPDAIEGAQKLLEQLGALKDGVITPMGRLMLRVPAHPRLARLLVSSQQQGVGRLGAVCAAILSERDPFLDATPGKLSAGDMQLMGLTAANLVDRVERMERWLSGDDDDAIARGTGEIVRRAAEQFEQSLKNVVGSHDESEQDCGFVPPEQTSLVSANETRLSRALLDAFPDRLARQRQPGSDRGLMVGGQGVRLKELSSVRGRELYLCIEVMHKGRDADVRLAVPIESEWLDGIGLRECDECFFNPSQKRVVGRKRRYWYDLVLAETPTEVLDRELSAEILWREVSAQWDRVQPLDNREWNQFLARLKCLAEWMPDDNFPVWGDDESRAIAKELCKYTVSIDGVKNGAWLDYAKGAVGYECVRKMDQFAPERMRVPSGNELTIDYTVGQPPSLSVRLQEVFGWQETPRIAQGRQPLLLRLLAPNYREVQVTQDLASFWRGTYNDVRKELKRRYSKHHWPEDPLTASATRSGLGRDAD